ncbi:MAG: ABC-2 type transport system permease protein [Paraglaciecola sp.]|jgi:hypothetical protein
MLHLLKLEWLKQKEFTIFRVMTILFLIALPSLLLIAKSFTISPDSMPPFMPTVDSLFQFPNIWQWLGYIGSWLTFFFMGFLGVLMVTNEYSNKTLRQNIITGLSRTEYFLSKLYFILAISLCVTVYYTIWCLLFGFAHTETVYLNTALKNADYIYRFFLMSTGYMSLGLLIGLLIKRTGIALFLYLAYVMILEKIIRYAVHLQIFKHQSMKFYPVNSFSDLAPFPYTEMAADFAKKEGFDFFLSPMQAVITASVFVCLFLFLSYQKLQKGDL